MIRNKNNKRRATENNYFSICDEVLTYAEILVIHVSLHKSIFKQTYRNIKNDIPYENLCISA